MEQLPYCRSVYSKIVCMQDKSGYVGAQSVLKKLTQPGDMPVKELTTIFNTHQNKPGPSRFVPGAECVVSNKKKKKKAAVQKKPKPSSVTVVVLKKFTSKVPRGDARETLASSGRIQSLRFTRDMSSSDVKQRIMSVFNLCSEYTVLESDSSGHNLCKCSEQDIDGESVVGRKGSLYICETFPQVLVYSVLYRV